MKSATSIGRLRDSSRGAGGFTLIEMVVSLAMVAFIAAALLEGLRFSQRTHRQIFLTAEAHWEIFSTQAFLRRLIEMSTPVLKSDGGEAKADFHGARDRIQFVGPARMSQDGSGLYRYELYIESSRTPGASAIKRNLAIRWHSDTAVVDRETAATEEILVEDISSLELRYLRQAQGGAAEWVESWTDSQNLPSLVQIQVKFRPGDARQWQNLLIAPRITHDALCYYDAVAQNCR